MQDIVSGDAAMSAIHGTSEFVDTSTSVRISRRLTRLWSAFEASRKRGRMRAELYRLNDWELADMGLARGEIEHVVLNHPSEHTILRLR
jgi:uncharacterized protein YjiS (DUF1127 family)